MKDRFAIFIDIDNTLTGQRGVNQRNCAAIKEARSSGHYVFINTGRGKASVTRELIGNIEFDGMISGIGSLVEINNKVISENVIEDRFVLDLLKRFWNKRRVVAVGRKKEYIKDPSRVFMDGDFMPLNDPCDFEKILQNDKILKIDIMRGERTFDNQERSFLKKSVDFIEHKKYIECFPKGCSKSGGMFAVLEYLGIGKERSIAIGDSLNDTDMMKNAGIAVAMRNAPDNVKEYADFVSLDCDDGGVGYAIEKLLLNKNCSEILDTGRH